MALKVKAVERLLKFTKDESDPGVYRYVMSFICGVKWGEQLFKDFNRSA